MGFASAPGTQGGSRVSVSNFSRHTYSFFTKGSARQSIQVSNVSLGHSCMTYYSSIKVKSSCFEDLSAFFYGMFLATKAVLSCSSRNNCCHLQVIKCSKCFLIYCSEISLFFFNFCLCLCTQLFLLYFTFKFAHSKQAYILHDSL